MAHFLAFMWLLILALFAANKHKHFCFRITGKIFQIFWVRRNAGTMKRWENLEGGLICVCVGRGGGDVLMTMNRWKNIKGGLICVYVCVRACVNRVWWKWKTVEFVFHEGVARRTSLTHIRRPLLQSGLAHRPIPDSACPSSHVNWPPACLPSCSEMSTSQSVLCFTYWC